MKRESKGVKFREWLLRRQKDIEESAIAALVPSTGRGGGSDHVEDDDDGGGDGNEWNWEWMERRRWNLLKWCSETASMKDISMAFGDFVGRQKTKKVTYMIMPSRYPPPKYVLQLRYNFDVDVSPLEQPIRKILEKSDLHKPLGIESDHLYRALENDEVSEYMTNILCLYLSTDRSHDAGSPFTQSHFGQKKPSALSNHFSFNVWNGLKKRWASKVLPQLSELAIQAASSGRIERPKSWMDVGNPEVESDPSKISIPSSVTVYDQQSAMVLSSVVAMIPFDWNYIR